VSFVAPSVAGNPSHIKLQIRPGLTYLLEMGPDYGLSSLTPVDRLLAMASKKIILGICGGIAAYKAPELVRRLRERDFDVQVVMTRSAHEFVTETTLQAVSANPVRQNLWDKQAEAAMGHIELARWADLVLIAPATAEIMSRLAAGAAPDLLTTLCLATEAPIVIAPAMNHVMWSHPAVQENRQKLLDRGVRILGPDDGDQACGETGPGRMLQPVDIVTALTAPFAVSSGEKPLLAGKTVLVTAGPTHEALDPVRFISNRSSGKMGYALAMAAQQAGAKVILVSGPVSIAAPDGIERIDVESAKDMFAATHAHIDGVDIFISAAAVADYYPADIKRQKIKKSAGDMSIELVRSPDILASVAKLENGPFTVGFAAETENLRDYARAKLEKKNLHMIVANKVGRNKGFDVDENAVEVYWRNGEQSFPLADKAELARDLMRLIAERYNESVGAETRTELPAIAIRD
jgi:phosphopantothenoylcysteine decarboxylase/phosphopantothenate--cysteine ligase